jgi:hypothetical protein
VITLQSAGRDEPRTWVRTKGVVSTKLPHPFQLNQGSEVTAFVP